MPNPNTNKRRIDYIFGSANVAATLVQAGIEAYGDGEYRADHRGLFVDLNVDQLLRGQIAEMDIPTARGVGSSSPKAILKYKTLGHAANLYSLLYTIKTNFVTTGFP